MSTMDSTRPREGQLDGGAMSTADIVFFVLAGVAPMGVVVAVLSLSIALGNGAGVPGTYLIAGVVLALFSAGYVRMSRRITNVGGFYSFARQGLGRRAGGATAYVALLAYNAATIGIFGALSYFGSQVVTAVVGVDVSWQVCALASFLIVALLAYFEVTMSAKVLGVALAAEVLILLGFDAAVLFQNGFHGFSLDVFKPAVVLSGGFGVSLMLAFGSFVGFEATALYGEEARNPRRSVPRATYISLAVITGFYLVTTWAAISAYGVDKAQAAAQADPENFIFNASTTYLGQGFTDIMGILVMTSLFAAFLAFHCNTARYHLALARDGLLPRSTGPDPPQARLPGRRERGAARPAGRHGPGLHPRRPGPLPRDGHQPLRARRAGHRRPPDDRQRLHRRLLPAPPQGRVRVGQHRRPGARRPRTARRPGPDDHQLPDSDRHRPRLGQRLAAGPAPRSGRRRPHGRTPGLGPRRRGPVGAAGRHSRQLRFPHGSQVGAKTPRPDL